MSLRYDYLMSTRFACCTALVVFVIACASADRESKMDLAMKALVGRKIADVISEKSVYPESTDVLPNGNTVYPFRARFGRFRQPFWPDHLECLQGVARSSARRDDCALAT